jgi:transcription initiation factor TFIIIB Brf1 subunit/transcription initiation factor TFIIB
MRRGPFDKFRGHFFKSSKDQTISKGTIKIQNWGEKMDIKPNVVEEAKSIFSQITLKKGHKGSSIDATIATILFIASKITGGTLSL